VGAEFRVPSVEELWAGDDALDKASDALAVRVEPGAQGADGGFVREDEAAAEGVGRSFRQRLSRKSSWRWAVM
jgi:hypothetical protein